MTTTDDGEDFCTDDRASFDAELAKHADHATEPLTPEPGWELQYYECHDCNRSMRLFRPGKLV